MILGEEARVELALYANNYMAGLKKVEGETSNAGKSIESVFGRVDKGISATEAQYIALGNEAKTNARQQKILENAILALLRNGVDPADDSIKQLRARMDSLKLSTKQADVPVKTLGESFASMRDVMQGPIAAGRMLVSGFNQIKAVSDKMEAAFAESEQTSAILNSTIRATGGAAGFTAKEIQDLAGEFQNITKYEDDAVIGMQNVLFGFKNIKGDNFKKASLEILNMATVMGMDLTSAAQAVGKALDNPAKGLDSLSRQGFKFTDAEKAMMKSMQDAGNIAGAQNIILKELSSTYGGAAEAAGDASSALKDKLANAIGDVNEEIGRGITTRLAPFRERWLEIAKAVGASAKAQNDFNDAMGRMKAGKDDSADRLAIAENYLKVLEEQMKTAGKAGSALAEMYGGTEEISAKIEEQKTYIDLLKDQDRLAKIYGERATEENRLAAEKAEIAATKAKRNADATALVADAQKSVAKAIADAELQSKFLGTGMLSNKEMADLYGNAIIKVLSDTRGLVSESNKLLDPLKKAMETYGMAAKEIDAWLAGVEEWSSAGKAQQEAMEKAAKGTREAQAAMDAYNQSASTSVIIIEKMAEQFNYASAGAGIVTDTFTELGMAIASGEDPAKAFFKTLISSIGDSIIAFGALAEAQAWATWPVVDIPKAAKGASIIAGGAIIKAGAYAMAEGGSGIVTKPTLFLAGEAGPEPFAFGGANNKRGMSMGGDVYYTYSPNIYGSILAQKEVELIGIKGIAKMARGY